MTVDGRFVIKENNTWVLRDHELFSNIHIDMNAVYVDDEDKDVDEEEREEGDEDEEGERDDEEEEEEDEGGDLLADEDSDND